MGFKKTLPVKMLNIHYLQESIRFELQIVSITCKFISLYQYPSQASDDLEKFKGNLELTLDTVVESNLHLVVVI